jgi:hypothetical protein
MNKPMSKMEYKAFYLGHQQIEKKTTYFKILYKYIIGFYLKVL